MGTLRAGLSAAIDAFVKRSAEQRAEAARAMREALTQRAGGDTRKSANSTPKPLPAPVLQPPPPSVPQRDVRVPAARTEEALLVAALFTKPQTLAAAFIVAEVLAKPVALRDR